ncbi:hypothetical protein [Paenibacillus sp. S150]|uniref:hypothetical protein n=1 Tax=Paenibacillus sp. S150 TaxID=2749826 RepID=UPI001C568247|nr:hypothetical protein [Paenibacillus sp. S150]MBW4080263.1 hypothetical protein [Paenibacillus sp. S150]
MTKNIVYDLTSINGTMKGLFDHLNINANTIKSYTKHCMGEYSIEDFLDFLNITDDGLLSGEILLVTLHVTTNNDNCSSIRELGLLNSQQSLTLDTPLKRYLQQKGVSIDILGREIRYKEKIYDLSRKYASSFSSFDDEDEKAVKWVIYKLYEDYQINSFFGSDDVLDYGGYCNIRPEFLMNLAELLGDMSIESDWKKNGDNKCYVIKFHVLMSHCTEFTFFDEHRFALKKYELDYLDDREIELKKRKWILHQSLANIYDENYTREYTCFLKFDASVPFSNIIKIYSPEEYKTEYGIR